jgi:hypothetical protein
MTNLTAIFVRMNSACAHLSVLCMDPLKAGSEVAGSVEAMQDGRMHKRGS